MEVSPYMQRQKQKSKPSAGSESETSQTNAFAILSGSAGTRCSSQDSDRFYSQLSKFFESSGLSLVLNVRETIVDFYLLYTEVTKRGGYHQVTKDGKWNEVVSVLKLEGDHVKLSAQLEKLYASLLYPFELRYFYREPPEKAAASMQRIPGTGATEQRVCQPIPSAQREKKRSRSARRGYRNAYQIFLKKECARLKAGHGEKLHGTKALYMAVSAWRYMSEIERQPYVEESKKDKERFAMEISAQNGNLTLNSVDKKMPCSDGEQIVTSQPESAFLVHQAKVDLALKPMT